MQLPFFGTIDLNELEEFYEVDFELDNQRKCVLELWFDKEQISSDKMKPVLELLEMMPHHIKQADEFLLKNKNGSERLLEYLEHHIEELEDSEKEGFGISTNDDKETAIQKLKQRVYVKSISLWPESEEVMRIDYTIGHLITDYVICLGFNAEKKIESIEIES